MKCEYCGLYYPEAFNKNSMNIKKHQEWCKPKHLGEELGDDAATSLLEEIFGDVQGEEEVKKDDEGAGGSG